MFQYVGAPIFHFPTKYNEMWLVWGLCKVQKYDTGKYDRSPFCTKCSILLSQEDKRNAGQKEEQDVIMFTDLVRFLHLLSAETRK